MNAEGFEKLWQVPGVDKVVGGKDVAHQQYHSLVMQTIEKGKKNCRKLTYIVRVWLIVPHKLMCSFILNSPFETGKKLLRAQSI